MAWPVSFSLHLLCCCYFWIKFVFWRFEQLGKLEKFLHVSTSLFEFLCSLFKRKRWVRSVECGWKVQVGMFFAEFSQIFDQVHWCVLRFCSSKLQIFVSRWHVKLIIQELPLSSSKNDMLRKEILTDMSLAATNVRVCSCQPLISSSSKIQRYCGSWSMLLNLRQFQASSNLRCQPTLGWQGSHIHLNSTECSLTCFVGPSNDVTPVFYSENWKPHLSGLKCLWSGAHYLVDFH